MKRNFFYRIIGFEPSLEEIRLGGYGFSIELDGDFTRKAFETELPKERHNFLQKKAKDIIKKVGSSEVNYLLYSFLENEKGNLTCLVHSVDVPDGNACGLDLDMRNVHYLKDPELSHVEYLPHNVDNIRQSYELLSLWLIWQDIAEGILDSN